MTAQPSGVESLYPFLYPDADADADPAARLESVLADATRSTVDKITEIVALRERVAADLGERLEVAAATMAQRFSAGARLFVFGNGGSSTDAADVAQLFLHPAAPARPLPAWSLSGSVAPITALANDVGFEVVFARLLAALSRPGDIAFGISTSGGSENVLAAFEEAGKRGVTTVGLAGYDGGRMAKSGLVDHLFVVPSASVHRIQEAQTTVYHALWALVQDALGQ